MNENPGVRPIGAGEVLRRIMEKAINWILKDDIQRSAGLLQTATGLKAEAEAAIYSTRRIFEDSSTEAVILVDVNIAFNSINRKVALHNIQVTFPSFGKILISIYPSPSCKVNYTWCCRNTKAPHNRRCYRSWITRIT